MYQQKDDLDELEGPPRRGFIVKFMAGLVGSLVAAVPFIAAGGFLLGPILKKRNGAVDDEAGFLPLDIRFASLPMDGPPQLVTVVADRTDAWNFYPQQPVGSIWLRRTAEDQILAFNTICPHLGCSVDYRSSHQDFYCPCHLSNFDLAGVRQNMIPPRDMDALETKVEGDRVFVKFQNFRGGIAEKTPV